MMFVVAAIRVYMLELSYCNLGQAGRLLSKEIMRSRRFSTIHYYYYYMYYNYYFYISIIIFISKYKKCVKKCTTITTKY
jgi:hypothetical protein